MYQPPLYLIQTVLPPAPKLDSRDGPSKLAIKPKNLKLSSCALDRKINIKNELSSIDVDKDIENYYSEDEERYFLHNAFAFYKKEIVFF